MAAFCRDCLHDARTTRTRCPACRSPRVAAPSPSSTRSPIAHVDCDAFYATIEKRDDPTLADKPLIIGGGKRGVVVDRLLHRAHLRRAFGDADVQGAQALPARHRHPAGHGQVRRRRPRGARADARADAAGRAALDRRGVHGPGRHRAAARHERRQGRWRALPRKVEREHRHHGLDRARRQQVPGQDRLRSRQAARLCRARQGRGRGVPRRQAGDADLRRRQGRGAAARQGRLPH